MSSGALLLVAFAPGVLAQSVEERLDLRFNSFVEDHSLSNGRLMPETAVARIGIDAVLNVNMYNRQSCTTPVQVEFAVKGPAYATAVVVPSTMTMLVGGDSSATSQNSWKAFPLTNAHLEITVGRDAPAMVDGLYEVTMKARGQAPAAGSSGSYCSLGDSRVVAATYRVKNDFVPRTTVSVADAFAEAGPNERIVLPIQLDNLGNGPARVTVNLQPSEADAFRSFSAGPAIRLSSPLDGRGEAKGTMYVTVTTPADWGYTNRISTLTATVTTAYDGAAAGSTLVDATNITFSIQTEGTHLSLYGISTPAIVTGSLFGVGGFGLLAGVSGVLLMQSLRARWRAKKAHDGVEKTMDTLRREEGAKDARRRDTEGKQGERRFAPSAPATAVPPIFFADEDTPEAPTAGRIKRVP
jgi:hypothetical protein